MKFVKICPKCASINIAYQTGVYGQLGERTPFDRCKDCNFTGIIPEIKGSEVEEFRKAFKKTPQSE
jgi:hypothetical protein